MADEVVMVMARSGLLDALEALESHLGALIIIGAQAVYLHTGHLEVALAEFTTDADLAVNPGLLLTDPLVEEAMSGAGFTLDLTSHAVGSWRSPQGVMVDLMVPAAVAGTGRRSVDVPPHDAKSMRKTRGIEAALVDNSRLVVASLVPADDPRAFEVSVAGPTALLVAKLHKIHDRIDQPKRLDNKDAHDVFRLLCAMELDKFVTAVGLLQQSELTAGITGEALSHLSNMFAGGPDARGSAMAGAAEELVGNPRGVAESVALLAQELLDALGR